MTKKQLKGDQSVNVPTEPVTVDTKRLIDWQSIRAEWDLGQLDVREIARQHGCGHSAILNRAKRKAWPVRPEKVESVTALVTNLTREAGMVTNSRHAISSFERVIGLLLRHRKMLGRLSDEIVLCLEDIAKYRNNAVAKQRDLSLNEVELIANMVSRMSQAMSRLVPLERKAFGLSDEEGPSEFDAMSQGELEAVESHVKKALEQGRT